MMAWFNNEQKSQINMTKQQILFNDFTLPVELQQLLKWKFGIFITLMKKYVYDCKMMEKFPLSNQFKQKLSNQWKIENSGNEQLAPDNQQPALRHRPPPPSKKNNINVIF